MKIQQGRCGDPNREGDCSYSQTRDHKRHRGRQGSPTRGSDRRHHRHYLPNQDDRGGGQFAPQTIRSAQRPCGIRSESGDEKPHRDDPAQCPRKAYSHRFGLSHRCFPCGSGARQFCSPSASSSRSSLSFAPAFACLTRRCRAKANPMTPPQIVSAGRVVTHWSNHLSSRYPPPSSSPNVPINSTPAVDSRSGFNRRFPSLMAREVPVRSRTVSSRKCTLSA